MKPSISLWGSLLIAALMTIFLSALFPNLKIFTLSPFLAIAYNRMSLEKIVWLSTGCGLILDLYSSTLRFGMHALILGLTTLILYKQRHHFFEDKPHSLCLFTLIISQVHTIMQWLLAPLSGVSTSLSWTLVATDLIILPLADALYALICFYYPLKLYAHIRKIGFKQWLKRLHLKDPHEAH